MRIAIINSPKPSNSFDASVRYLPLGLLSLASACKAEGAEILFKDLSNLHQTLNFDDNLLSAYLHGDFIREIKDFNPEVLGLGCFNSAAFGYVKKLAAILKEQLPRVPIVLGGIHPTIFHHAILEKYHEFDFIILGEGEASFPELVKAINTGKSVNDIDGLAWRQGQTIKINPKTKYINNLDSLHLPDYSLIQLDEYAYDTSGWYTPKGIPVGRPFPLFTSRSCPGSCTFCSVHVVHGKKIRFMSEQRVLNEIKYLTDELGATFIQITDDNFTASKKRVMAICEGIVKNNINIQYSLQSGAELNSLDGDVMDALVQSGLIWMAMPIESGSEYLRREVIHKRLSQDKLYEVFNLCSKYKQLFKYAFFVLGMPQETHETLKETWRVLTELPIDKVSMAFATPYPGTALLDYLVKEGLMDFTWQDFMENAHLQHGGDDSTPHFAPHSLTIEELVAFKKKCLAFFTEKRQRLGLSGNTPFPI